MSERPDAGDQIGDVVDRYLSFLRGEGAEPDLGHLSPAQRRSVSADLAVVDALAGLGADLPPLDDDPVAKRLGLVSDPRPGHGSGSGAIDDQRHSADDNSEGIGRDAKPDGSTTRATGSIDADATHAAAHDAVPYESALPDDHVASQVLQELEQAFHGQVVIDHDPMWRNWVPQGPGHLPELRPYAQCTALGDVLAVFLSDAEVAQHSAPLALFLRTYPDVAAVAVASYDTARTQILTAASCNKAVDPVRGWLEPGEFVSSDSMDLCLARYFERRLPRWDRISRLDDLLTLGDPAQDAVQLTRAEVDRSLSARPRLPYKRAAQQALREVDPGTLAGLVTAVQSGALAGDLLVEQVLAMAGDSS